MNTTINTTTTNTNTTNIHEDYITYIIMPDWVRYIWIPIGSLIIFVAICECFRRKYRLVKKRVVPIVGTIIVKNTKQTKQTKQTIKKNVDKIKLEQGEISEDDEDDGQGVVDNNNVIIKL